MQLLRKWEAAGARAVNSGHDTSPALRALETAYLTGDAKKIWGPDVGRYYPGPAPYQPLRVTHDDATTRTVHGCAELNGFAQDKRTHRPAQPRQVLGIDAQQVKRSGKWLMNAFYRDKHVSCAHVTVRTQQW